jgi:hypothetical protein
MPTISIAVAELGTDDLPRPGAQVSTRTAKGPQDLEPAANVPRQPEGMLPQLLGLLGFQAVDELMQVAVIMCCGHTRSVRQAVRSGRS